MMARGTARAAVGRSGAPSMWVGIPDEAVAADIVLPEQFRYVWHHSSSVSGERALAVAVVAEALHDLARYRFAIRLRSQRLYWQAYDWVMADDTEWPFAFVNLCDGIGVDVAALRERVRTPVDVPTAPLLDKAA